MTVPHRQAVESSVHGPVASPQTGWVRLLRVLLALIAVRGATNFLRPFGYGTAFVFFGKMMTGATGNALAIAFGALMLAYAWGAWRLRRWSLPLGIGYALFVALNIPLFALLNEVPESAGYAAFGLAFLIGGVGVTAGAAYLLWRHRDELT